MQKVWTPLLKQILNKLIIKSGTFFNNGKLYKHLYLSTLGNDDLYWQFRSVLKAYYFKSVFNRMFQEKFGDYIRHSFSRTSVPMDDSIIKTFEYNDFRYRLADGFLTKVDRASMYNSLEIRCPYLDKIILDTMSKLPSRYKMENNMTKVLLRDAYRDLLPSSVFGQPKMGFSIPMRNWIHDSLWKGIEESIKSSIFFGFLQPEVLEKLYQKGNKSAPLNPHTEILWRLYIMSVFELNNKIDHA